MAGKVWLVGAGPSDVGLLTVKGKEVLEQAEVVVYDALVGAGILSLIPSDAEKINAGKRASHHLIPQEQINELLLEKALAGKRVVRLKGGDPFLFGRGGEELELLAANEIPYEIVPGVTSAISVPAYNGIPVTHRDYCSSVHIITGHKKKDRPLDLNFKALKEAGGTLVFLMGVTALPEICQGLIDGGMDPKMPAAILQKGASSEQRTLVADLATLPRRAVEEKIETPAIIVVGEVCALHEKFRWIEKLPLFGCRVALTRPKERLGTISSKLRALGAQVIEIPTISTKAFADQSALAKALGELGRYTWIAFTSPAGVDVFFDELKKDRRDVRALANLKFAAIGNGTAKHLAARGVFADLIPEVFDGKHLGIALREKVVPGDRILLPRAKIGTKELTDELEKAQGVETVDLPVYDTVYEKPETPDVKTEFEKHPQTAAVFTSASTVRGFVQAAEGLDFTKVTALCIGEQTAAQAKEYGMQVQAAGKATIEALISLVVENHEKGRV